MSAAMPWARPVTSGGLESVKWYALACMLVDHVNVVFFGRELPLWAEMAGRLSFPLFALAFGYNLARPSRDRSALVNRLMLAGLIAQPFHSLAFSGQLAVWPLNIMFLFAAVAGAVACWESRRLALGVGILLVAGFLVEYGHYGLALCIAAWAFFRKPSTWTGHGLFVALVGLCVFNGNAHALWALPVFWVASRAQIALPRPRWAFYAFYPAHLAALVLLR